MTDFLEEKIRPLVEALSTWPDIKTFSSCEGHPTEGPGSIPHVAFRCDDTDTLSDLCRRLKDTHWTITLQDFAITSEGVAYTLRPVPGELQESMILEEVQSEISQISELISKEGVKPEIENHFPVRECPECGGTSFDIAAVIAFELGYKRDIIPKLTFDTVHFGEISCKQCGSTTDGEEAKEQVWELFRREVNNYGFAFYKVLSRPISRTQ